MARNIIVKVLFHASGDLGRPHRVEERQLAHIEAHRGAARREPSE